MAENVTKNETAGTGACFNYFLTGKFFTVKMLLLGLVVSQIISFIHVYLSNTRLYHSLKNIDAAGYLTVPNQNIIENLNDMGPAFYGGFFFTLSAGALLSLSGLVSAFIWIRFFRRKKILLIPFIVLWAGLTGEVNTKGFLPIISLYFILIPSIVFFIASRHMPPARPRKTGILFEAIPVIMILVLAIFWTFKIDSGIFINIRDNLLLSNSLGIKINDFYYRYTLYPAEAVKSLDQKLIRTYRFNKLNDETLAGQIRKKLANNDYLELNDREVDLGIEARNNNIIFSNKGKIILTTPSMEFLKNPEKTLSEFSIKTDRQDFFRRFIFFSLISGLPAMMIIFFYSILAFFINLFFEYRRASSVSLSLCLIVAVLISAYLNNVSGRPVDENNLSEALKSDRWQNRVKALRIIDEKKMDIARLGAYQDMLTSPHIPVRYWLAKTMGSSRRPETYKYLLAFMDDPSPNVVCMAYYSAGKRTEKRTETIKELLKRIKVSGHWYEQWYAYKALRALGWKQKI
ncbi:MAG: HEAT repeat domain-containing protein [Deltaproteobacteria bacterium]|nr:HEAT repeat domain-containing protein [Deltaproteobacteria bacterium]